MSSRQFSWNNSEKWGQPVLVGSPRTPRILRPYIRQRPTALPGIYIPFQLSPASSQRILLFRPIKLLKEQQSFECKETEKSQLGKLREGLSFSKLNFENRDKIEGLQLGPNLNRYMGNLAITNQVEVGRVLTPGT